MVGRVVGIEVGDPVSSEPAPADNDSLSGGDAVEDFVSLLELSIECGLVELKFRYGLSAGRRDRTRQATKTIEVKRFGIFIFMPDIRNCPVPGVNRPAENFRAGAAPMIAPGPGSP